MIICKKKQIQSRKLPDTQKKYHQSSLKVNSLFQKNHIKYTKDKFNHQKSYEIDPWHIQSNSKFEDINTKNLTDAMISKQISTKLCNSSKKINEKTLDSTKQKMLTRKAFQIGLKSPNDQLEGEMHSPTKIDMLQCSFRFDQYEHQKAQQLKGLFMQKLIIPNQDQNNTKIQKKVNFIERNIKYAFEIDSGRNQKQIKFQKKKTIQQTKKQLILNKQKLQQQSKEIHRIISMKEKENIKTRSKSQIDHHEQNYTTSYWSMSYIQRPKTQKNKLKRKSHSTISQWKHILLEKSKSQQPRKQQSSLKQSDDKDVKENLFQAKKYDFCNLKQNKKQQLNKTSETISKKINRMWKIKNKSTIVIEHFQNDNIYALNDKIKDKNFHTRIHSNPSRREEKKSMNNKFKQNYLQSIDHQNFKQQFQNQTIFNLLECSKQKSPKKYIKSRSFSACEEKSRMNGKQKLKKRKPYETDKQLITKAFCIEGNTCQMSQLIVQ